jgi:predicted metal-dependent phosphoesterase TrpH
VARPAESQTGPLPQFEATAEVIGGFTPAASWRVGHPERGQFRARLEKLAALGVDGIEAANGRRAVQPVRDWQALAKKMGLVATGGSDWHGGDGLGDFGAGEEVLGDFLARLGARVDTGAR